MFKVEYVKTPYFTSTQLSEVNRATNKSPKWWLFFLFFFFEWITPQKNFQPLPHNHCKHLHLPATCRVSRAEWQLQADARAALTCFHNTLLGYKKKYIFKKIIYICAYILLSVGTSCRCRASENPNKLFGSPLFLITFSVSRLKAEMNPHSIKQRRDKVSVR